MPICRRSNNKALGLAVAAVVAMTLTGCIRSDAEQQVLGLLGGQVSRVVEELETLESDRSSSPSLMDAARGGDLGPWIRPWDGTRADASTKRIFHGGILMHSVEGSSPVTALFVLTAESSTGGGLFTESHRGFTCIEATADDGEVTVEQGDCSGIREELPLTSAHEEELSALDW